MFACTVFEKLTFLMFSKCMSKFDSSIDVEDMERLLGTKAASLLSFKM